MLLPKFLVPPEDNSMDPRGIIVVLDFGNSLLRPEIARIHSELFVARRLFLTCPFAVSTRNISVANSMIVGQL